MFKKKSPLQRRSPNQTPATPVFSYRSSRLAPEAQRVRYDTSEQRRSGLDRLKNFPVTLAIIVIVGSLVYASLLDTSPRVMVVASKTGKPLQRPPEVYEAFIAKELSRSVLNRSKISLNTEPIVSSLQRSFPEVANAVITVPLIGHRPIVRIAVSSPAFILATTSGAYYISSDGKPLVRVADVEKQVEGLTTISDETRLSVTVGKQILPTDTVDFISTIIGQLQATNTAVERISLPLEANEVQLRIPGKPYFVRFNSLEDARQQVGTFLAVKNRLESSGEMPQEYIDVRVVERAYYK